MRILFLGDIFGKPGRRAVSSLLRNLRKELGIDFCIANGENAAGGAGINRDIVDEMLAAGVDVLTGGNHTWDRREGYQVLEDELPVLRPANYVTEAPGRGVGVYPSGDERIAVINLVGRIFLPPVDCPFQTVDTILESLAAVTPIIVVDLHAEATSEKQAIGWYLDGRVSLVVGTHTHVQTADACVMPRGTAYITDAGMTGPHDSIIGVRKELALQRLRTHLPVRYQPADGGIRLEGAWVDLDPASGRATAVQAVRRSLDGEA